MSQVQPESKARFNQSLRAEARKLFTLRSVYGFLLGMLLIAGPGILLAGQTKPAQLADPLHDQVWFFITAGFTRLLIVVLGIRAVTDEFRHGTIVPSLLSTPLRGRLLAAKAVVLGTVGLIFTLLAELVMVGVAFVFIPGHGAEVSITAGTIRALIGMAGAGALWAVIGVALGAIIRHQIPAIVGALLWLLPGGGIEELVRNQLGKVGDYLPGNAGLALALSGSNRTWMVGLVLSLYAAVLIGVGIVILKRRDITT